MSFGCETALGQRNQSAGATAAGASPSTPYIPLARGTWGLTASVTKVHHTAKALDSSLRDLWSPAGQYILHCLYTGASLHCRSKITPTRAHLKRPTSVLTAGKHSADTKPGAYSGRKKSILHLRQGNFRCTGACKGHGDPGGGPTQEI